VLSSHRIALAATLALTLASGCFSVRHAYDGDKLLTSDPDVPGYRQQSVRHFAVHQRRFYWIHGGYPVGPIPNGAQMAANEVGDHGGVVNLRIREGQDLRDLAISHVACVLTIFCGSWSVWTEGDVVDFQEVER
jgi:hypothetical protein